MSKVVNSDLPDVPLSSSMQFIESSVNQGRKTGTFEELK